MKKNEKWPKFSKSDIIELYVGNINKNDINQDKKWSFCLNKLNQNQKSFSGNNINNINKVEKLKILSSKKKSLSIIGEKKIIYNNLDKIDSEDENIILKGLFFYIGDFDNNILLSFSCLDLLAKLLDNGFNPEIEIYLRIFKTRKISDYQSMRLEEIIKKNKGGIKVTNNALKILSILMEDKNKEIIKKVLIKDEEILNQLLTYNNRNYD